MANHHEETKYDAKTDAETLHKVFSGLQLTEKQLIEVFAHRPRRHLVHVNKEYKRLYGQDLEHTLKSHLSGNFEKILVDLCEDRTELKCKYLQRTCGGNETDELVMIEILCPCNSKQLRKLQTTWKHLYSSELKSLLKTELSEDFSKLMAEVLKYHRAHEDPHDEDKAKHEAEGLAKEGEGKLGTNEDKLYEILSHRSRAHLHHLAKFYQQITGHSMEKSLKSTYSLQFRQALVALVTPPAEYYARMFEEAFKGLGTKENDLIRLMSTLSKSQLKLANEWYSTHHKKTLAEEIVSETSGTLQHVIVALIANAA